MRTTKQATHTPGPWEIRCPHLKEVGRLIKGGVDRVSIGDGSGIHIATVFTGQRRRGGKLQPSSEAQANAALIAAAPELLSALRELVEIAAEKKQFLGSPGERAWAAIAKAEAS